MVDVYKRSPQPHRSMEELEILAQNGLSHKIKEAIQNHDVDPDSPEARRLMIKAYVRGGENALDYVLPISEDRGQILNDFLSRRQEESIKLFFNVK